jgi:hypothetical protein
MSMPHILHQTLEKCYPLVTPVTVPSISLVANCMIVGKLSGEPGGDRTHDHLIKSLWNCYFRKCQATAAVRLP